MQIKSGKLFWIPLCCFLVAFFGLQFSVAANENDLLPVQQNRKLLKLNGNVVSLLEQKWVLKTDTAIYNTTSNIILDSDYYMIRSEEASFNKAGDIQQLKTITLINPKDNTTKDSLRYFYYKDARLIGISNFLEGKRYDSMAFHYPKKGDMDYYKSLDINNGIQYKMVYTYEKGKVVSIQKEDSKGKDISSIQLKYKGDALFENQVLDDQERIVETRRFATRKNKDGNTEESYSATDAKGNMKGGLVMVKDAAGNTLEQNVVDGDRNISENYTFKYDVSDNRIDTKILTGTQSVHIEYRYTYDVHNNWTKKETFTNDILTSVVVRKITYGG
jgi:hypothetical protein